MKSEYILILLLLLMPATISIIDVNFPKMEKETNDTIKVLQAGYYTVNGTEIWQNEVKVMNQSIMIKNATLILINVTLIFNETNPEIYIDENGTLKMNNCTVKVYDPSSQKFVIIQNGTNSQLWINDTVITDGGRCIGICGAIFIYNGNATINNTRISDSRGIVIWGAKNVTVENMTLENYKSTAIYIKDSINVTIKSVSILNPDVFSTDNNGIHAINTDNLTMLNNKVLNSSYMLELTKEQFKDLKFENNLMFNGTVYSTVELIFNQSNLSIDYNRPEFIIAYSENISAVGINGTFYIVGSKNVSIINATIELGDVGIGAINVTGLEIYHNQINKTGYGLIIKNVKNYSIYLNSFEYCNIGQYIHDDGAYVYDNGYYGNYWKMLPGVDENGDGINDEAKLLDADSIDRFPLNRSQFKQDTLPPRIFFLNPENNSYINEREITFNLNIVDEWSGLAEILYSIDNRDYVSIGLNKSFSESFDEGSHNISVKAVDKVGNYAVSNITIIVDLHSPLVNITNPVNNSYIKESFLVSWESSDNVALDKYEIYFDDIILDTLPPDKKDYYFEYISDGSHEILVKAYDKAGNIGEERVFITIDTTTPSISLISPANGTYTNSSTINLLFEYTDKYSPFYKIEYSVNGSTWKSESSLSFTITFTTEGRYIIRVRAYDKASNFREIIVILNYDKTPPKLTIKSPKDNETYFEGGLIIAWEAEDPAGIAYFELYINGSLVGKLDSSINSYYTALRRGNYIITIVAYDNAGNKVENTVEVKVISAEELVKEEKKKPIIDIPLWVSYIIIGIGFALMAFSIIYRLYLSKGIKERETKP